MYVARMPPAPHLAHEMKNYAESRRAGTSHAKPELRKEVIRKWQSTWDATTKGSWMKRLIPGVVRWWYHGTTAPRQSNIICRRPCRVMAAFKHTYPRGEGHKARRACTETHPMMMQSTPSSSATSGMSPELD